ncbi:hypothetical protein EV11_0399 [Prochlorococcus sp. SS52]|nr:hypothetical protein EV04_1032 [Prochlorococcus marinus str. LG]KGG37130.1 hypothetical protein EV11_0399 [Prochlorococcus sp. SS52]
MYDIDGILRFTGSDRESCMAYAELLDIGLGDYCLMDLPDSKQLEIKRRAKPAQGHLHQAKNNN